MRTEGSTTVLCVITAVFMPNEGEAPDMHGDSRGGLQECDEGFELE